MDLPLKSTSTPAAAAKQIRDFLKRGGSVERTEGMQWFFKEEIRSHGWYTAPLRKAATHFRRALLAGRDIDSLFAIADELFSGCVLEEKIFAVFLLQPSVGNMDDAAFQRFESWLPRISSWADHDALVHYLIAPQVAAKASRAKVVFRWAKSENRWSRRAACVALIQGTRAKMFFPEIVRLSNMMLADEDDMVQKGLGWLLRETAKANPAPTVKYLMSIRKRVPRLVLRTACETLPLAQRRKILA
jgi:3-methyladenine DNA glycosylase AlkD